MRRSIPLLILVACLTAGCAGGGDEPSDITGGFIGGGGGSTLLSARFDPDDPSPPARSVAADEASASGAVVTIRVEVTDVNDVFGASFDVTWDPAVAEYLDWDPGSLLESGGNQPAYQVISLQPGLLVVGISRTGGAAGADAAGSVPLISLSMRALQAGETTVSLENASLLDGQSPPQSIGSLSWLGGTLTAL